MREDKMIDTLFPPEQTDPATKTEQVEDTQTEKAAAPDPEKAEEPEPKPEPKPDDQMAKLLKRLEDKDRYIGKQGDEIGKLRKKLEKLSEALGIEGDPEEALKEKQEQEAEKAEELKRSVQKWVSEKIPQFEENLSVMRDILREDSKYGVTEDLVKAFESDPYRFSPDTLVGLAERAALRVENAKLKKRLEELPKKLGKVSSEPPKTPPADVKKDSEDVDIYGTLGIYRIGK